LLEDLRLGTRMIALVFQHHEAVGHARVVARTSTTQAP
jgi:hypothetical protein